MTVHRYKLGGYNMVLDICSGSVHVVDDMAYDLIGLFEEHSKEEAVAAVADRYAGRNGVTAADIEACYEEIASLKEAGSLFTPDAFRPMAGELKRRSAGIVKALCLHVAHTCNLTCAYCFAGQGRYRGPSAVMSFETGKRALDFLVEHSASRRNLEVDFFGGEPLMNFGVVKRLVAYARGIEPACGKRFRFTLTTNGMLVDEDVIDFSNREMDNVVMSLDGRREIHDRYRVDHAGRGSFDRIVPKFQRFAEARGDGEYYVRGTFTHANPDFLQDIQAMLDLGFTRLSMEPVVCAPDDPAALTEDDLPIVLRQYEQLADLMIRRRREGRPFVFYHYMIDLEHGPCIYKRLSGCGAGTEYMAVTPQGDLYPCHRFVGDEAFLLGNIWDGVTRPETQEPFAECNVYARPECAECWARFYCSGGCPANAFYATGSVRGIHQYGCQLFRRRMECALMAAAVERLDQEASDPDGERTEGS